MTRGVLRRMEHETEDGRRQRFAPDPARLPNVVVQLVPLALYEGLLDAPGRETPHERDAARRHGRIRPIAAALRIV